MRRCSDFFLPHAVAVAAAIVCVAPAMAQNTTATVAGQVLGGDGKPVAGANVTIVHRDSGTTARATTDALGRYVARGLRVGGPYTVTVAKDGTTDQRADLFFGLADEATVDFQLQSAQRIVVTGRGIRIFDAGLTGAATQVNSRELNSQASISGSLQDFARFDPRISQTDKERGEISALGQNSRFNAVTIDGVRINDTFGLEANNLPTAKQPVPLDAIQSLQINISNYDVAETGYTGASINAVTKSGTNEFKGSGRYALRDEGYVGERFNRTDGAYVPAPAFQESTKVLTLGGPIIKDKLFFFAAFEDLKSSRNTPEFGALGSSLTNVGLTSGFVGNVQSTANTRYGINVGDFNASAAELRVKDAMFKIDWNINDSHRAYLRLSKTDQSEPIYPGFGVRSLGLSSHWYQQVKSFDSVVAQWFADWTPELSTEVKLSRRNYDSVPDNNSRMPQVALNVTGALPTGTPTSVATGTRTLLLGTERSRHFNQLATEATDLFVGANYKLGAHEIKAGADLTRLNIFNAFLQDTLGNYTFTGAGEAATLALYAAGTPSSYQVQVAAPGFTLDDGVAHWKLGSTGLLAQDTWKLSNELRVMFGVRVDQLDMSEQDVANTAAAAAPVAGNPTTSARATGGFGLDNRVTPDGSKLIQPRVGFNWALKNLLGEDLRGQLRGGFGLFQGTAANVWLSNPYSNNGVATRVVGCGIAGFPACGTTPLYNPDPAAQPTTFAGATGAANVDFLSPNLRQPSIWKASLALDHELPWWGLVAGAELIYNKTKDGIYYKHLNLGVPTRTGSDGRELFYTTQGYNAACWTAGGVAITNGVCTGFRSRALNNASFNNVLQATGTDKGGGSAVTLAISKPAREGVSWSAAYTYTNAKEVSPLTSSVANSNWAARSIFNPNEEVSANSAYLVRDRVNAKMEWSQALGGEGYRTSVGVFYEGRRGRPYSWTINNDLNGDGLGGNDLMYIPSAPGSGEVAFAGATPADRAAQEARFWDIVNSQRSLNGVRGRVADRNNGYAPFVNSFDLRVAQEIPGFIPGHKMTFAMNIQNFGNLLNPRWGRIDEIGFQNNGGLARSFVNYAGLDAQGRYIYNVTGLEDFVTRQARGESQWAMQLSLKYDF
jgi:hypothetical protein